MLLSPGGETLKNYGRTIYVTGPPDEIDEMSDSTIESNLTIDDECNI
jgi:hypothetical protein